MREEYVREELKEVGGNVSKLARRLGLDYSETRARFGADSRPVRSPTGPMPGNIQDLGRNGLERFVIAVKSASSTWPTEYDEVIADARKKFEAGTHTMCQHTGANGWVVLYLVPLKKPAQPNQFFSSEWGVRV